MKKLLLLATILAANIWSAKAQTQTEITTQQDSLVNINSKGEVSSKYVYEYTYDTQGRQTQMIYYKWLNNAWKLYLKDEDEFDAKGNHTKYVQSSWEDTAWEPSSMNEYTYDENNNNTLYVATKWDGTDWVGVTKSEYAYDTKGNKTLYMTSNWKTNAWVYDSKYEYAYDENNNKTQQIYSIWKTNAWEKTIKKEFIYDTKGYHTQTLDYGWFQNDWSLNCRYEYTYDENGNMTLEAYFDVASLCLYKTEYAYDENNNKIQEIYSSLVGEALKYSTKKEWAYDERGNKTQEIQSKWGTTDWEYTTKKDYTYDKYNNQIIYQTYKWKSGDWVISSGKCTPFSVAYLKVTMPVQGLATVFADENLVVPNGYAYAMQYNAEGNYLNASSTLKKDEIIPGGQGYLFEAAGTDSVFVFFTTTKAPEGTITSCLSGVTVNTPQSNIGGTIYTLANGTKGMGFYHFTGTTLAAGKAFYSVAPPVTKEFIGLGEETAINELNANSNSNSNGKFLENGKIFIVKNNKKFNVAGQSIK